MKLSDLITETCASGLPISGKVVRLWAIAMLDYRGPAGDLAWQKINDLVGIEAAQSIAFLTGFNAGAVPTESQLRSLVPQLEDGKPYTR